MVLEGERECDNRNIYYKGNQTHRRRWTIHFSRKNKVFREESTTKVLRKDLPGFDWCYKV